MDQPDSTATYVSSGPEPKAVGQTGTSYEVQLSSSGFKPDFILTGALALVTLLSLTTIGDGAGGAILSIGRLAFCGYAGYLVFQGRSLGFFLAGTFSLFAAYFAGTGSTVLAAAYSASILQYGLLAENSSDADLPAGVGLANLFMLVFIFIAAYSAARIAGMLGPRPN